MSSTITNIANQNQRLLQPGGIAAQAPELTDAFSLGVSGFLSVVKRSYKLLVATVIVALMLGVVFTLLAKPVYRAAAVIRFESSSTQTIQIGDSGTTVQAAGDFERESQTQIDLIKSRAMAKAVYEREKLSGDRKFLETIGFADDATDKSAKDMAAAKESRAIGFLQSSISAEKTAGTELTSIKADTSDPQLSAQIANAYADAAVQLDLEHKFDSSSYARNFLSNQLNLAKQALEESEVALNQYVAENGLISVAGNSQETPTTTVVANLANSATTANAATNQRIAAEQAWRAAQAVPMMSVPQVAGDPQVQALRGQLSTARSKLRQDHLVYGDAHPIVQADEEAVAGLSSALNTAAKEALAALKTQYETAQRQEAALLNRVGNLKGDAVSEERLGVRYNFLKREVDTNRALYDALLQRQKELTATSGVNKSSLSVVDNATVPGSPISPNLMINLLVSLVGGLFFGLLMVLLKSQLDQRLRTPEDIASAAGLPILGVIPKSAGDTTIPEELDNPRSSLSEAFFSTRAHIALARPEGIPSRLLVTSGNEGEGKSTTAYSLARTIARMGKQVLIIDADLRRPSLHRLFGIDNKEGLAEVLSANAELTSAIRTSDFPNLSVLVSGAIPPSPTELLAHSTFDTVLSKARDSFDIVLIDGPPILGIADALLLASKADGVVFVTEAERATRTSLRRSLARLNTANPDVLGVIVEKFSAAEGSDYYYYAYNYAYSERKG